MYKPIRNKMDAIEFRTKLIALFVNYEFTEISNIGSIHGVKTQDTQTWRSQTKDSFKAYNRYMFISGEMYPGTKKNFIYAINYTKVDRRKYRCKTWHEVEMFKNFTSGKTFDELFNNIVKHFYYDTSLQARV